MYFIVDCKVYWFCINMKTSRGSNASNNIYRRKRFQTRQLLSIERQTTNK